MLDPAMVIVNPIFWQVWRPDSSSTRKGRSSGGMPKAAVSWVGMRQFNATVKPRYRTHGGKIIPLDLELRRSFDIWLSYHPGNSRIPRVAAHDRLIGEGFRSHKIPVV
jgi:hypothetical protein